MPKTEYLELYTMESSQSPIKEFVQAMVHGEGTSDSPLSDPQKIDAAIKELNANKQSKLTPGFGISIVDGVISLSLTNASEEAY
ncbi:MAG: hypothetical protein ACI35W_03990 [Anaeroplasmataceae bacterium]